LRAEASAIAHESFDGALVVKTMGGEAAETERFAETAGQLRDAMIRVGRVRGLFDPVLDALPSFATLTVLLVGAVRLRAGAVGVADVVGVAFLFTVLAFPVRAIGWVLAELPRSVAGWDRVRRVLDATGEVPYGAVDLDRAGATTLRFDGVDFGYGDGPAVLRGVSFEVPAGHTVALVGPTGAGKSTIAALAARLVDPTGGRVLVDGVDLRDLAQDSLVGAVSLVAQVPFVFDDTVRGNVSLDRVGVDDHVVRAALGLAQLDRFVAGLPGDLDAMVGERGTSLSGGQRQRLTLARALAGRPGLLILDDATSAVDPTVAVAGRAVAGRGVDPRGRLPAGHHRAGRRGGVPGRRPGGGPRHPRRADGGRVGVRRPGHGLRACRARSCRPRPRPRPVRRRPVRRRTGKGGARPARGVPPVTVELTDRSERPESTLRTLRRGVALSPELSRGLAGTLLLAAASTAGRVAVPVAIQQGIDRGLRAGGGADVGAVARVVAVTATLLAITTTCTYLMNLRLYTVSETALANVRTRTFRHIHDLSVLHQQAERRGSLVSRVTSDVDQLSQFLQWGGVILITSSGQLLVATAVMLVYSWQLTLVVFVAFAPLVGVIRLLQRKLAHQYNEVRSNVGALLAVVSESVVGAAVIRAYGVGGRTERRMDVAIERHRAGQFSALRTSVTSAVAAEFFAGLATAAVVVAGVASGVGGGLSVGRLVAFLFLVTLFVQPVQVATEVINEAQNAVAGWRRVLDVIEVEPDVADPADDGVDLPPGPLGVRFDQVHFAYPGGPEVLSEVDLAIEPGRRIAVVGETGSGKTTFAKLLTRLMDPTSGRVLLTGVPLSRVRFESLRRRVALVPQDGFLFDATIGANVAFGRVAAGGGPPAGSELLAAFAEVGLADWLAAMPDGIDTAVGERGEAMSVGERQLVALVRAHIAGPDLLVLDEATSAVDPATEVRLQRALDAVTHGRTTVTIAHRLSTAQAADEIIVIDRGRVVQRGPHATLVADPDSVYGRLYASWLAQTR
jgi:ABC-type multidrug transport system fused ATPase/permease subunit